MAAIKICFVIPEYNQSTPTHFNYLYQLIRMLSKDLDIFLVIEKSNGRPDFLEKEKFYLQKFQFFPLRAAENLFILLKARVSGYKNFYIHYSFLSAFNASIISRLSSARTFYWNCGLPWLYQRDFFREQFERLVYRLIDFLVTGTEGLKNQYAQRYRLSFSKIKVFPNWIDLSQIASDSGRAEGTKKALNISGQTKVILFVHRLSKRKGAHYLPVIAETIKGQNAILLVIGDGPEKTNLEFKIKKSGLENTVKLLGWVPNQKIIPYLAIADLFIMPSEEEGFPHVLLEAMAIGIPFIAFAVGGVKEICPPEMLDYIVPAGDIGNFIKKIQEILGQNPEKLELLRLIEQNWVKQFDLKLAVERFKKLFA